MLRATTIAAGVARRARVILALAEGQSYAQICAALGVTDYYIARWKRRVVEGGILVLGDLPRAGRQDHRLDPAVEAKILARTQQPPAAPYTHWTTGAWRSAGARRTARRSSPVPRHGGL